MHRVEDLADRPWDYQHPSEVGRQRSIVPLEEILADVFDCGANTKKVREQYLKILAELGSEFAVLLDAPLDAIAKAGSPKIAEAVQRVREGKLKLSPGYDGEFGLVSIFRDRTKKFETTKGSVQIALL